MEVQITKVECQRCGHVWKPRYSPVRICPACKTPYFDTKRSLKMAFGKEVADGKQ